MKKPRKVKDLLENGKYKVQEPEGYNWDRDTAIQNRELFDNKFADNQLHDRYFFTKETILKLLGMKKNFWGNYKQEHDTQDLVALEVALSIDNDELKIYLRGVDKDGNPIHADHAGTHIPIGREP
jgi:hypothetical protein